MFLSHKSYIAKLSLLVAQSYICKSWNPYLHLSLSHWGLQIPTTCAFIYEPAKHSVTSLPTLTKQCRNNLPQWPLDNGTDAQNRFADMVALGEVNHSWRKIMKCAYQWSVDLPPQGWLRYSPTELTSHVHPTCPLSNAIPRTQANYVEFTETPAGLISK